MKSLLFIICSLFISTVITAPDGWKDNSSTNVFLAVSDSRKSRVAARLTRQLKRYDRRIARYDERLTSLYDKLDQTDNERKQKTLSKSVQRIENRMERLEKRKGRLEKRLDRIVGNDNSDPVATEDQDLQPTISQPDSTPTRAPDVSTPRPVEPPEASKPPEVNNSEEDVKPDTPAIIVTIPGIELPEAPELPGSNESDDTEQPIPVPDNDNPEAEEINPDTPASNPGQLAPGASIVMNAETGDFSQWRNPDGGGSGNHSIVDNPVYAGKYAYKWTHKNGRTESASDYLPVNQDVWIGWSLWFPENFNDSYPGTTRGSQGLSVTQWHSFGGNCDTKHSIFHLRVAAGQFFIWGADTKDTKGVHKGLGSPKKNQWQKFLVNAKFTRASDGYFRLWIDGQKVLDLQGASWGCDRGPYLKAGTYAHGYSDGDYILGDEFYIGTSRQQVER